MGAVEQPADPGLGLVLERGVADAERLVDHQDLGVDLGGDREGQPHVHPAGVILQRQVGELAQAGELVDRRRPWRASRLRLKPSMAPLNTMLSKPESSGLKPAPISISGATLPRISTVPVVAG